ncbi:MAG: two-component sensor histidine kinase [Rhodocyclaceae bacterium]|nr:two-component sensor histidine kinase [Rhodocyclaceae bacterium]MBX3669764.1 two-component sensor histidine kinase [Rhodocyclaceae bacterium]
MIEAISSGRRPHVFVAAAALVLAALVWLFVAYKVEQEEQLVRAGIERDNANLARAFAEHTTRTFKSVDQAVLFLKFQYEKLGRQINIADYVREGMIISNIFNQLGVIDESGKYILSSIPEFKPVFLGDREHFKVHVDQDSNQLFVSKPVLGRATGKWSMQLTRRINKADGSFGGVVVVSVDPFYFSKFYSDVDLGKNGVITLVGQDGIVRARRAGDDTSVGQDISQSNLFEELKRAPSGNFVGKSPIDGINRFYSFRALPDYPFLVEVGVGEHESLQEFYERRDAYYQFAAMFTLAALAVSLLLALLIRELQQRAEILRVARERAESANLMKSEFLASMSHELRTPLNGILGYAEYLRDDARDNTNREFADTIYNSGRHLLELVNSILDLAKIEAGKMELEPERFVLRALLSDVVQLHRAAADAKGLALLLTVSEATPEYVVCDKLKLGQILNNLLHNALKFTDHGSVTLSAGLTSNSIHFEVIDTGCGIPEELQNLVFEKFRQADAFITRRHGGTGLGLSLVKQLVELMQGRVWLHSRPGAGTTVGFSLPRDGLA